MKGKTVIRLLCSVICVATLTLQLPLDIVESEAAPTNSEIDRLEQQIEQIEKDKQTYQDKIEEIASSSQSALQQKAAYEQEIALMESKIATTEALIEEYKKLIDANNSSVDEKNAEYEVNFEKVRERLRIRYESGISNQLVYILESESFTDFLVNMERTADIISYDRQLMKQITEEKNALDTDRAILEQYKAEQEEAKASLNAEKATLTEKKATLNSYITALNNDEEKYKKMLEEAEAADEELNRQLEKTLRDLANDEVVQHPVDKSSLIWPVSITNSTISSYYGERTLWGRKDFHYGIDIPAPAESNVYAAQSGTVVISANHYSYGNYVVINHGGGYTTLYAHNTKNLVSVGQVVNRGDVIALVGTTGNSSGNHCHFEVRYNGAHQNPLNYVNQP